MILFLTSHRHVPSTFGHVPYTGHVPLVWACSLSTHGTPFLGIGAPGALRPVRRRLSPWCSELEGDRQAGWSLSTSSLACLVFSDFLRRSAYVDGYDGFISCMFGWYCACAFKFGVDWGDLLSAVPPLSPSGLAPFLGSSAPDLCGWLVFVGAGVS